MAYTFLFLGYLTVHLQFANALFVLVVDSAYKCARCSWFSKGKRGQRKGENFFALLAPKRGVEQEGEGAGVQGWLLLYRLPRMLYILLPESRQAASRSLDSTSSSVESCKQIHLYVQTCICCSRPPLPPPLFTLPLLRFTSCYSRAQSIFQVFTAAAGTDGD